MVDDSNFTTLEYLNITQNSNGIEVYNFVSDLSINDNNITNNSDNAIYLDVNNIEFSNITDNNLSDNGGGIYDAKPFVA